LPKVTSEEDEQVDDDEGDADDGAGGHVPRSRRRCSDDVDAQQEDLKQNNLFLF